MGYIVTQKRRGRIQSTRRRKRTGLAGLGDAVKGALTSMISTTPSGGAQQNVVMCSTDGKYVWTGTAWVRPKVGQVCTSFDAGPGPTSGGTQGGTTIVDTDTYCVAPTDTGGPVVTSATAIDPGVGGGASNTQTMVDGYWSKDFPGASLQLAKDANVPITRHLHCTAATPDGLNSVTKRWVLAMIAYMKPPQDLLAVLGISGDGDKVSFSDYVKGASGEVYKKVVTGQIGIWAFDYGGQQNLLFVNISGDPANPLLTFSWGKWAGLVEGVVKDLSSLSPIQPEDLCQFLPVASKVPNPYVAVGSLVLQMSGKCTTCPPGMLKDQASNTCMCPPGTQLNSANQCVAPSSNRWLMPVLLLGGGALLIAAMNKKKKAATP